MPLSLVIQTMPHSAAHVCVCALLTPWNISPLDAHIPVEQFSRSRTHVLTRVFITSIYIIIFSLFVYSDVFLFLFGASTTSISLQHERLSCPTDIIISIILLAIARFVWRDLKGLCCASCNLQQCGS